jgi:hypothetical protein
MGQGSVAGRRVWWKIFGLLVLATGAWSLAVPLMTGPDEDAHAVRAAAVARRQLTGSNPDEANLTVTVSVPEGYRSAQEVGGCHYLSGRPYRSLFGQSARPRTEPCPEMSSDRSDAEATTYEYRGQPIYYAVVGLPSLVFSPPVAAYAMRLVGGVVASALLASAFVSLLGMHRRRLAVLGGWAVLTPTVLYFASVINSSGLEVASAVGVWSAGVALVRGSDEPDGRLVRRLGVATVALAVARGLGPVFVAVALATLALLAGRARLGGLLRQRAVQAWLAAAAGATAASVAWLLYIQTRFPLEPRDGSGLAYGLSQLRWWPREMVGVFGPTTVVPPVLLHLLWLAAVITVFVLGWRAGSRRELLVAGGLLLAGLALMVSGEAFSPRHIGFPWQGRHFLPIVVGAPVVALTGRRAGEHRDRDAGQPRNELADGMRTGAVPGWATAALFPLLVAGNVCAFAYAQRHYTVGFDGPRNPLTFLFDTEWSPPLLPPSVLLLVAGVALATLGVVLSRAAKTGPEAPPAGVTSHTHAELVPGARA